MKSNYLSTFVGSVFLALPIVVQAQPASNVSGQSTDVVELSPFVVNTDQDVGYLATNTLAGSRLNTSLKDTAASISVFTAEFLSDIGAFDLSEAVRYAANVEYQLDDDRSAVPNGNETVGGYQSYRIRGLRASVAQNYFRWSLPMETGLVERIEDSRGPNSVLFGIASPGGLLNSTTKQAQVGRSFRKASLSYGSFESYRAALDVNQVLANKKLAVRLNTIYNRTNTFRHWQHQESKIGHLGNISWPIIRRSAPNFRRARSTATSPAATTSSTISCCGTTAGGRRSRRKRPMPRSAPRGTRRMRHCRASRTFRT